MSRQKDNDELGMNVGTASNALRKQMMFLMAKQLNRDICFQCGRKIESVKEFTIDHKIPWRRSDDPKQLFFDLDNIAFSHGTCNTAAARRGEPANKLNLTDTEMKARKVIQNRESRMRKSKEERKRINRKRYLKSREVLRSKPKEEQDRINRERYQKEKTKGS